MTKLGLFAVALSLSTAVPICAAADNGRLAYRCCWSFLRQRAAQVARPPTVCLNFSTRSNHSSAPI